jgi:hypothetical protein
VRILPLCLNSRRLMRTHCFCRKRQKKKCVIAAHSMGSTVRSAKPLTENLTQTLPNQVLLVRFHPLVSLLTTESQWKSSTCEPFFFEKSQYPCSEIDAV